MPSCLRGHTSIRRMAIAARYGCAERIRGLGSPDVQQGTPDRRDRLRARAHIRRPCLRGAHRARRGHERRRRRRCRTGLAAVDGHVSSPTAFARGSVVSPDDRRHRRALPSRGAADSKMFVRANSSSSFSGGELIPVAAAVRIPASSSTFHRDHQRHRGPEARLADHGDPYRPADPAEDAALSAAGARDGRSPASVAPTRTPSPSPPRSAPSGRPRSTPGPRAAAPAYTGSSARDMVCASGRPFAVASRRQSKRAVQRATCFGDSGGPLLADTPTGPRLLGDHLATAGSTRGASPSSPAG